MTATVLWVCAGYLLGSVPFGLVLTRFAGAGDIRRVGSGNIGATNVLRAGHRGLAAMTLIADAGKAALAFLAGRAVSGEAAGFVAGLAAILGHCFPVWLGFRGGKAVAAGFGFLFAAMWKTAMLAAVVWLVVAMVLRYSSLAALSSLGLLPLWAWLAGEESRELAVASALAVFVFLRHLGNVRRLIAGVEDRIGRRRH